jgi:ABC-type sugar transport system ATPase subunit
MEVADRVVVMNQGRIEQQGAPDLRTLEVRDDVANVGACLLCRIIESYCASGSLELSCTVLGHL